MRASFRVFVALAVASCAGKTNPPGSSMLSSGVWNNPIDLQRLDYKRIQAALFHATNDVRQAHGLLSLSHHPLLELGARRYAKRMASKGFMEHIDPTVPPERGGPDERMRAVGIKNPLPAENLASFFAIQYERNEPVYVITGRQVQFSRSPSGPPIPVHTYASFARDALQFWMESSGHRANILERRAIQLGCGAAFFEDSNGFPKFKLVQLFQLDEPVNGDPPPGRGSSGSKKNKSR